MPDFDAIVTALAARFAPGVTTAPTNYDPITVSTGDLPAAMLPTPCVLVFMDTGDFTAYPGKRDSAHNLIVRFYYGQIGSPDADMVALRKWLAVLVDQLKASTQLGGIVTSARVMSYQVGVLTYGAVNYSGIELRVKVIVNEAWAAVA